MSAYPGLGLPLRHVDASKPSYPIGAHVSCFGSISEPIPVRELAMMDIMEKLTDKKDWYQKAEALAIPNKILWQLAIAEKQQLSYHNVGHIVETRDDHVEWTRTPQGILTENAFDCCVQELRSKAVYFRKSGIIPTLDACASVAKSDVLVTPELHSALIEAFARLKAHQATAPDWHLKSKDMVQNLVHPSSYPLVYGRTKGFQEECVGVIDAITRWAGTGTVIPKIVDIQGPYDRLRNSAGGGLTPPQNWSSTYQWLPANVRFQSDGKVKFSSYINNLHPTKYASIYRTIEYLIGASLPMWDQCLALGSYDIDKDGVGRTEPRFPPEKFPVDENPAKWVPSYADERADADLTEQISCDDDFASELYDKDDEDDQDDGFIPIPFIPEPTFEDVDYVPREGQRLIDKYRESGIQIIVKMTSIELTPEKPECLQGAWHVEGQMNEHICATALYYLDSENVTSSSLSFRMQTSPHLDDEDPYAVDQDGYHWMEQFYGTALRPGGIALPAELWQCGDRTGPNPCLPQRVPTPNSTKPGYRRFIALWLVDPTQRILLTANVPPQQMDWYVDSLLGHTPPARSDSLAKLPADLVDLLADQVEPRIEVDETGKLPLELTAMVKGHFAGIKCMLPMTVDEARMHREELMTERTVFVEATEMAWQENRYDYSGD